MTAEMLPENITFFIIAVIGEMRKQHPEVQYQVIEDLEDRVLEGLKGGTIDAMVVQDPFRIGFEAVKTLVDKLNGAPPPPKRIDLPARVIRKTDLDNPEIQELLHPDVKKYLQ